MAGFFLTLEGGEGAGKSTQEEFIAEYLTARGRVVVRTREPGGTPAAEAIRNVVLSTEFSGLDDRAEALLFAASRGEHVARVIRPALDRGEVVLCDRYLDSSVAYQGYGRNLGPDTIRDLSLWATRGLLPDLVIVLDIDPRHGLSRVKTPDRLESEPLEYHDAVRAGFLDLAAKDANRYLVVDASQSIADITREITGALDARLP